MSHIMRSCWTEETFVCIFCKSPSESIHHSALLYFIVCLNTSPHGKLGAETSMEKMTRVTTQGILEREGEKKKTWGQMLLQMSQWWIFHILCIELKNDRKVPHKDINISNVWYVISLSLSWYQPTDSDVMVVNWCSSPGSFTLKCSLALVTFLLELLLPPQHT